MRRFMFVAAGAALSFFTPACSADARDRSVGAGAVPVFDNSGRWPSTYATDSGARPVLSAGRQTNQHLHNLVSAAAAAAGVPAHFAHAMVKAESNYRPHVVSSQKAVGMGQIKCQTARGLGFRGPCSALLDPEHNLRYSMMYLRQALDRGGEGCAGLSLYERGIAARPTCTAYGRRVAALAASKS